MATRDRALDPVNASVGGVPVGTTGRSTLVVAFASTAAVRLGVPARLAGMVVGSMLTTYSPAGI